MITCQAHPGEDITYRACGLCIEEAIKRITNKGLEKMSNTDEWSTSDTGYPEPTVITVDENTDFSKIHEQAQSLDSVKPKIRRQAVGIKMFTAESGFLAWQHEEPREIFEITPTACASPCNGVNIVIFVTYNAGIIE